MVSIWYHLWYQCINICKKCPKILGFPGTCKPIDIIPTRCRDLPLKQFCLEDIVPAVLIILITHIVLAVQWMLIKILSRVINKVSWGVQGICCGWFRYIVAKTSVFFQMFSEC